MARHSGKSNGHMRSMQYSPTHIASDASGCHGYVVGRPARIEADLAAVRGIERSKLKLGGAAEQGTVGHRRHRRQRGQLEHLSVGLLCGGSGAGLGAGSFSFISLHGGVARSASRSDKAGCVRRLQHNWRT